MSIKTAYIVPTAHLGQLATLSNYHLTLAHRILEDKKYTEFYNKRRAAGDFVITDNSAYELGHPIETPKLLKAAKMVNANEVVCPDYLYDGEATIKSVAAFMPEYLESCTDDFKPKLMAVPQGKNVIDYIKCYTSFIESPDISTIGLSFLGLEKVLPDVSPSYRRFVMLDKLHSANLLLKPIHLLGIADNPVEIKLIAATPAAEYIRGNDSSSAYVHGAKGIEFDPTVGMRTPKSKEKINFDEELKDLSTVTHNISMMQLWAGQ